MDVKEKVDYWLDIAFYDLDTAYVMLESKRFLYVGFMCHQVIEKILKAYFWNIKKEEPPYTHNLLILSERSEIENLLNEKQIRLINDLMPLNIQARYPKDKDLLLKFLDYKKCEDLFEDTKEFYLWIKTLLK
ncbi:MAG: HEPN domain-containing protein [Candidatus Firestonebacteria bacterium]|nr:HEPN domain-containing protein [Candidatus Firestonebacteria bacterium]